MTVQLGPWTGVYNPSYRVTFYRNGDPSQTIRGVDLSSITSISTSKSLQDIAGTFQIQMKDAHALNRIREMDVVTIALQGHKAPMQLVFRGVVDEVVPSGSSDPYGAQEDVTINGRCMAKYLQVNSLFLPVWDPNAILPTALTFGMGDILNKAGQLTGTNAVSGKDTPKAIFDYIINHFVYGKRQLVGESGTPNSRYWIGTSKRFEQLRDNKGKVFTVPFIQFDEATVDVALQQLEILGFTEAWVDEIGNVVYRHPQWDAPVQFQLGTDGLQSWSFPRSDLGLYTYVEVVPTGNPGLSSANAQALMAGRAPVPSDYLHTSGGSGLGQFTSSEFVIQTDGSGKVTADGAKNHWYQLQRRLGLRPLQVSSPLLFTQQDAQRQAQGLLQFMSRFVKSANITIPGEPYLFLGTNIQIVGTLRGQRINRTFYVEGVQHNYQDGSSYTTTLQLTHGRDPTDPKWGTMILPSFTPTKVATDPGVLNTTPGAGGTPTGSYKNLVSPFVKAYHATLGTNTDMGVDFGRQQGIATGDPILAIGDCWLRYIDPNWYAGQPAYFFELKDKSAGYWGWYVGEEIDVISSIASFDSKVTLTNTPLIAAGTTIGTYAVNGTGIEIGWAAGPDVTASQANGTTGLRHSGGGTPEGNNFFAFLKRVGAIV